jgi:thymidylate synthase (FAD)
MKLIKPSVEYIPQSEGLDGMYKHIELCSRICYKSEDRITEDSAKKMIDGLIKAGHGAMLEHGTAYLQKEVDHSNIDYINFEDNYTSNPYSKIVLEGGIAYVTTNLRVLVENNWLSNLEYICKPTEWHKKRYTLKFTCARIDSQSITRYRHNSYAQESQRVINYMMERYGMSVTFSQPIWVKPEDLEELKQDAAISEQLYFKWIKKGYKPEEARYFLINGTKTEIMATAYEDDWRHFFDERLRHTTGRPSSDMHHLAQLAWNEFKSKLNLEL